MRIFDHGCALPCRCRDLRRGERARNRSGEADRASPPSRAIPRRSSTASATTRSGRRRRSPRFTAIKGVNFKDGSGTTTGTIQAAYVGDTIYFLLSYDDPTQTFRRIAVREGADGKWTKLNDPDDKGGDNNKYYEDKFALMWNINNSIFGFTEKLSCQAACHAGEPGKPFGNKYTADETETRRHLAHEDRAHRLDRPDRQSVPRQHPLRSGEVAGCRPQERRQDRRRLRPTSSWWTASPNS